MITEQEVKNLVDAFWTDVKSGRPGSEMEHFFVGQGHVMVPGNKRMDLESHQEMHRQLCDEAHTWGDVEVIQVGANPQRAHASAVVGWEASFADGRPGRIKSHVEEQWLVERGEDGQIRFVLYRSPVVDFAEDSAELNI